jgi:glycosyltransferase involved in cell wall biosynthesis
MDIYALASLWEGMPISLLEAMGCGKPVVATDVIGNNEIVVDRDTGFLVPKGDAGMLAEKIINLIDNLELRNMMGEKGKEKVKREFSAGDMISKTEAVYERVLS